jgi:Protoglobin
MGRRRFEDRRSRSLKKNQTDGVHSTAWVPLGDVISFVAVMNDTIKPYLAAKGHSSDDVQKMHLAWCKSMQIQLALWLGPYAEAGNIP